MDVEQKISPIEMNRMLMVIGLNFIFILKYIGKRHPDGVWYFQPKWFSSCCGGCTFEESQLEKKKKFHPKRKLSWIRLGVSRFSESG